MNKIIDVFIYSTHTMRVLVFDTETTGLPAKNNPSIYQTHLWPHILQISYILYDTEKNKVITSEDYLIKIPSNVNISAESTNIHGITRQQVDCRGYAMSDALNTFQVCLDNCDFVIAHNIQFDKNILMVEAIRHKMKLNFDKPQEYCTMKNGVNICKLEKINTFGDKYFKYPTLSELHNVLFNKEPQNLHNAFVDILICLRCFHKMIYNEDLCQKNKRFKSFISNAAI